MVDPREVTVIPDVNLMPLPPPAPRLAAHPYAGSAHFPRRIMPQFLVQLPEERRGFLPQVPLDNLEGLASKAIARIIPTPRALLCVSRDGIVYNLPLVAENPRRDVPPPVAENSRRDVPPPPPVAKELNHTKKRQLAKWR